MRFALGVSFAVLLTACATRPPARVELAPCTIAEAGEARCGTLRVPENWSDPSGRGIDLNMVIFPATGAEKAADPIYILQGGPGQGATTLASFYAETYAAARASRDLVLVDQRGTGKSHPLNCDPAGALDLFPPEAMRRCAETLAREADLTRYTTADAVRDVEAVRRALGYERLNLYGTSYGTRLAMQYASAFPSRVRTLTLKGVVPPDVVAPNGFAEDTERALRLTMEDCAADDACRGKYPNLADEYAAMRARLANGPVEVNLDGMPVVLTRGNVAAVFRSLLQSLGGAADVPRLIHAAANGDWTPVATVVRNLRRQTATAVSSGLMLSVLCSEDAPHLRDEPAARETFLGSYWIDQVRGACAVWPSARAQRPSPKVLAIPTLMISGHLDPATPPARAESAMRFFPNARHVVARYGSHSFSGMSGCIDRLMVAFVESANPPALDDSCAAKIVRPPFK